MSTPAVRTRNLTRILNTEELPVTLVQDINLNINRGEFVSIVGHSGCGKSSLLYLLGLLDRPSSGDVDLDGSSTAFLNEAQLTELRLQKLGFVFQFHFLLQEFTALDNVCIPMRKLGRYDKAEIRERAAALLASLGLEQYLHRLPGQLSGGQRQKVAIARALANEPLVILADEPTGSLDSANGQLVFDILRRLAVENGQTIIMVTHDLELAEQTDRRIHLKDGLQLD